MQVDIASSALPALQGRIANSHMIFHRWHPHSCVYSYKYTITAMSNAARD